MGLLSKQSTTKPSPFTPRFEAPYVLSQVSTSPTTANVSLASSCSPEQLVSAERLQPTSTTPRQYQEVIPPIWGEPPYRYSSSLMNSSLIKDQDLSWRRLYVVPGEPQMNSVTKLYQIAFNPISVDTINSKLTKLQSYIQKELGISGPIYTVKNNVFEFVVDITEPIQDLIDVQFEENVLEKVGNLASNLVRQLQFFNLSTNAVSSQNMFQLVSSFVTSQAGSILNSMKDSSFWFLNILGGGRLDLPKIWNATAFNPNYTFVINLCAPEDDTFQVIQRVIVPLYCLMMLSVGQLTGKSGIVTYAPYILRMKVPGVCYIPFGFLNSLTIQRVEQLYTEDGTLLGVSVQIGISSLYATMLKTAAPTPTGAVTVVDYLSAFLSDNRTPNIESLANASAYLGSTSSILQEATQPTQPTPSPQRPSFMGGSFEEARRLPAPTSSQQQETYQKIYDRLTQYHGLPDSAAKGIAANAQAESSFNPNAIGDNGTSEGLWQWHGSRRREMLAYTQPRIARGEDPVIAQTDFLVYDMKKNYRSTYDKLLRTNSSAEAAEIVCREYERPRNVETEVAKRSRIAQSYG